MIWEAMKLNDVDKLGSIVSVMHKKSVSREKRYFPNVDV